MAKTASKSKIGDAILPQNATKLTKTCGSEFGGPLWRHLTPQRKTAIWVQNYSPSRAQQPEMYDFWCAQACSFRAVLGLPIQTLTIATSAKRAEKII